MDKFDNKYRIDSHRFYGWDYSANGFYFITIVIQNRKMILGEIRNHQMVLSDYGKIVEQEWLESFKIRAELILDEFIVMPNHLHGLVILSSKNLVHGADAETHGRASLPGTGKRITPIQRFPIPTEFKRKPKSISSFIAGFKSATTSKIDDYIDNNELDIPKYNKENTLWQSNYHDRIARNEKEYWKIKTYIKNNPANWEEDEYNV